MEHKELLNYAIKGLNGEIAEIELKISKGYNIIDKLNKGQEVHITKSRAEMLDTIGNYRQKRDELQQKRDNLLFEEMLADEDRKTQTREENVIKVALSSILSKDTEKLGILFLDEIAEILNKIALKPYCERLGKNYYLLTEEDKQIIAEMQLDDYIEAGERRAREIEQDILNGEG